MNYNSAFTLITPFTHAFKPNPCSLYTLMNNECTLVGGWEHAGLA